MLAWWPYFAAAFYSDEGKMRILPTLLFLALTPVAVSAQDSPKFRDLDEGIKYLEDQVVGRKTLARDQQTLRSLIEVVSLADKVLAQGQQQDPTVPVTSAPTGSFQRVLVPRNGLLLGRRGGCFRSSLVYDEVCMWVPDPIPCYPNKKVEYSLSKLRLNAAGLSNRLLDPIATPEEFMEVVRQVYALAVMARDPFVAGKTHN